ncbi:MAG: hypothetical protein MJ090_01460 [Clostridia bacterium]|nr:hypothetical protein [Clostridia bacterium]
MDITDLRLYPLDFCLIMYGVGLGTHRTVPCVIFADFTSTGFDTALRQCELVLSSDRINMLNKVKLRSAKK